MSRRTASCFPCHGAVKRVGLVLRDIRALGGMGLVVPCTVSP